MLHLKNTLSTAKIKNVNYATGGIFKINSALLFKSDSTFVMDYFSKHCPSDFDKACNKNFNFMYSRYPQPFDKADMTSRSRGHHCPLGLSGVSASGAEIKSTHSFSISCT